MTQSFFQTKYNRFESLDFMCIDKCIKLLKSTEIGQVESCHLGFHNNCISYLKFDLNLSL